MTDVYTVLQDFKSEILRFMDDLIELLPEVPSLILLRLTLTERGSIQSIMDNFVNTVLPEKEVILAEKGKYFSNNTRTIFSILPNDIQGMIPEDIVVTDYLDEEDLHDVWRYFKAFLELGETYVDVSK